MNVTTSHNIGPNEVLPAASAPLEPTSPGTPRNPHRVFSDDDDEDDDEDDDANDSMAKERKEFRNLANTEKRIHYDFDTNVDRKDIVELSFVIECVDNVPLDETPRLATAGVFVRLRVYDANGNRRRGKIESKVDRHTSGNGEGRYIFNLRVVVENAVVSDVLKFSVYRKYLLEAKGHKIGRTLISVKDIRGHHNMPELWLFNNLGIPIFDRKFENPTTLCIRTIQARQRAPQLKNQAFALSLGNLALSQGGIANSDSSSIRQEAKQMKQERDSDANTTDDFDGDASQEGKINDNHGTETAAPVDLVAQDEDKEEVTNVDVSNVDKNEGESLMDTPQGDHMNENISVNGKDDIIEDKGSANTSISSDSASQVTMLTAEDVPDIDGELSIRDEDNSTDDIDDVSDSIIHDHTSEDHSTEHGDAEEDEKLRKTIDDDDYHGDDDNQNSEHEDTDHDDDQSSVDNEEGILIRPSGEEELKLSPTSASDLTSPKTLLMMTRGTRGDVQPFLALARGLAETYGWDIHICTEIRYKSLVEKYSDVERGGVHFVPSGGDTEARISKPIAQWAINTKMRLMQAAMLSRVEREYFDSEPAFFYWARTLQPDFLCYSFTTANIAFIISEALNIPMVGFFLQPTCLPSKTYQPITPLRKMEDAFIDFDINPIDFEGHEVFGFIKRLMENNPITTRLDDLYRRRGLTRKFDGRHDFEVIVERKFPVLVPIKEDAFGGHPADWPDSVHMSEFIFLRTSGVPELTDEVETFLRRSKEKNYRTMCICFSSMPVSRIRILQSALHILDKCPGPYKPSILALVGNRPDNEQRDANQEARAEEYARDDRLLIVDGAPFSKLFPRLDFLVTHGGLGTTAEALAAGVPCMVTGVLLMDQRFWGTRIEALGVGPPAVHISDFNDAIVGILPEGLDPNSKWRSRAKEVSEKMFPGGIKNMSDGVQENVAMFLKAASEAFAAPGDRPERRRRSRGLSAGSTRFSRTRVARSIGDKFHLHSPSHRRSNSRGSTMSDTNSEGRRGSRHSPASHSDSDDNHTIGSEYGSPVDKSAPIHGVAHRTTASF